MVGDTAGRALDTFSRKGYAFGDGAKGAGVGTDAGTYSRGVAKEGGKLKAAAVVGSARPLEGGQVDRLEAWQDGGPEPGHEAAVV